MGLVYSLSRHLPLTRDEYRRTSFANTLIDEKSQVGGSNGTARGVVMGRVMHPDVSAFIFNTLTCRLVPSEQALEDKQILNGNSG